MKKIFKIAVVVLIALGLIGGIAYFTDCTNEPYVEVDIAEEPFVEETEVIEAE